MPRRHHDAVTAMRYLGVPRNADEATVAKPGYPDASHAGQIGDHLSKQYDVMG